MRHSHRRCFPGHCHIDVARMARLRSPIGVHRSLGCGVHHLVSASIQSPLVVSFVVMEKPAVSRAMSFVVLQALELTLAHTLLNLLCRVKAHHIVEKYARARFGDKRLAEATPVAACDMKVVVAIPVVVADRLVVVVKRSLIAAVQTQLPPHRDRSCPFFLWFWLKGLLLGVGASCNELTIGCGSELDEFVRRGFYTTMAASVTTFRFHSDPRDKHPTRCQEMGPKASAQSKGTEPQNATPGHYCSRSCADHSGSANSNARAHAA